MTKIHGYGDAIILRRLPILGQSVYIHLRPARFQCDSCDNKPTTEETNWYSKRSKFTKAYEEWLMRMLINIFVAQHPLNRSRHTGFKYVI